MFLTNANRKRRRGVYASHRPNRHTSHSGRDVCGPSPRLRRFPLAPLACAALLAAGGIPARVAAQTMSNYSVQVLVNNGVTPRPDGQGPFSIWNYQENFPVIDGGWVVFRANSPSGDACSELWSVNLTNNTFISLVSENTHVPHGTGNFCALDPPPGIAPQARGGFVLFQATDNANFSGLYTVPTAGGEVFVVANNNPASEYSVSPDGGVFTSFSYANTYANCCAPADEFDVYGKHVVFIAGTTVTGTGVFSADSHPSGSGLAVVQGQPVNGLGDFGDPQVSGTGNIAFFAVNNFDKPFQGGYFLAPTDPTLVYAGNFFNTSSWYGPAEISGALLATEYNSPGYQAVGVTSTLTGGVPGASGAVSPQFTLWDSNTPLPGIPTTPTSLGWGFAFDGGSAAFEAADAAGQYPEGLYVASGGSPQFVIAAGDILAGAGIYRFGGPAHGQLSNGNFVFTTLGGSVVTISVASPANCVPDVTSAVGIHKGAYSFDTTTQQYVQAVKIVNTSGAVIEGPMFLEVGKIRSDAILANQSGYTACGGRIGTPYVSVLQAGRSLAPGASVAVKLEFLDPSNGTISHGLAVLAGAGVP